MVNKNDKYEMELSPELVGYISSTLNIQLNKLKNEDIEFKDQVLNILNEWNEQELKVCGSISYIDTIQMLEAMENGEQ